jgi:predicted nucleotidyltransferase component of viral defense system
MEPVFQKQVTLLLRVLPDLAKDRRFALHGGTAINLFFQEMPRLSVDIDLTWIPYGERENDLKQICDSLLSVSTRIRKTIPGIQIREPFTENEDLKLFCRWGETTIKIEVNTINRGVISPPVMRPLCITAQKHFDSYCEIQIGPFNQLYGGKIVAALDRQHPRDLFDCMKLLESTYDTDKLKMGFLFCLLSSKRPIHEILDPRLLDHRSTLLSQFRGMTDVDFPYEVYEEVRTALKHQILKLLNLDDKIFLMSFAAGDPDWHLHSWSGFPGIMWKLLNINLLKKNNPDKFKEHLQKLSKILDIPSAT